MSRHFTLGEAKAAARRGAEADEAPWNVYYVDVDHAGINFKSYLAQPECEPVEYAEITSGVWSTREDDLAKRQKVELDLEVARKKRELEAANSVQLTPDEKELLEYILRPEDKDRDFWPGADETKDSLWGKIRKAMT